MTSTLTKAGEIPAPDAIGNPVTAELATQDAVYVIQIILAPVFYPQDHLSWQSYEQQFEPDYEIVAWPVTKRTPKRVYFTRPHDGTTGYVNRQELESGPVVRDCWRRYVYDPQPTIFGTLEAAKKVVDRYTARREEYRAQQRERGEKAAETRRLRKNNANADAYLDDLHRRIAEANQAVVEIKKEIAS